jgi:endoglucanase
LLSDVAEADGIAHAYEVYTRITSTDADEIHLTRSGVPTGLVSIPTRYLHSPNEMCDLADIESIVQLFVAFAERLAADESFVR